MKQKSRSSIKSLLARIENSDKKVGWIVLGIYIIAISIIAYFHEPWFDEAQSWIIARDVPIKDIIFHIPHYEGHPPLWHLYLVPFTRTGFSYEFGIKLAAILVNTLAMGLVVFKAPFKKMIRYTIPFTYYFFFLYGVVSRCYSFTMLGFILMAITYKQRNKKPYLYVLSMMVVCSSTAYGILFCGGIAAIWLFEILKGYKLKDLVKNIVKDKRFTALILLLIFAVVSIYLIMPREDTFAANLEDYELPFAYRLIFMFVFAPLEATFFTLLQGNYTLMYSEINVSVITIITGVFMFIVLFACLYIIGRVYKKLSLLVIPYSFFAIFAGSLYFTEHHISVITYFLLFWLWICFDSEQEFILPQKILCKIKEEEVNQLKKAIWLFPAILIGFPLYWNVSACALEINTNYCSARNVADFIYEYNLEDKLIMTEWKRGKSGYEPYDDNPNYQASTAVLAYFDENIFYTLNDGNDSLSYNTHMVPDADEVFEAYSKWNSLGPPDVIIGMPDLLRVFGNQVTYDDYSLIKVIPERRISKDDFGRNNFLLRIYMRNDLVSTYGFTDITETEWEKILRDNYGYYRFANEKNDGT